MTVPSAWAPLRSYPIFRALWIAQFASNVGTSMQTVGAQWLLIDSSPVVIALVQHENRLTGADRRFEEEAHRYALGAPEVAHLFPPPASGPAAA